jgi:hypothetical protein
MAKLALGAVLLWTMSMGAAPKPSDTIGAIDFFGYQGLDVVKVRAALPVHVGDTLTERIPDQVEAAVVRVLGQKPTDVAEVCCDEKGRSLIYVGLPGGSYKPFALNPAPTGSERLPAEIVELEGRTFKAVIAAVEKGTAQEDDSQGYMLLTDPAVRKLQLEERKWALAHGAELLRVLRDSSDAKQRQIASEVLGYAEQSHEQIAGLEYATRDPDSTVRNNSIRALVVLVNSNAKLAGQVDVDRFIEMLGSGTWSDHNKAVGLLQVVSNGRDPAVLAKIRSGGLVPLIEMASWSERGHAGAARIVLGRVGGIPEDKLFGADGLVMNGPLETILAAVRKD